MSAGQQHYLARSRAPLTHSSAALTASSSKSLSIDASLDVTAKAGQLQRRSLASRIQKLAPKLSIVQISLDPPSPPPAFPEEEETASPPAGKDEKGGHLGPSSSPFSYWYQDYQPINSSNLLQVPRGESYFSEEIPNRSSPPPRRCSYASTLSENSSISLTTSYQSLLSPFVPSTLNVISSSCGATRRNSSLTRSNSEQSSECPETPPTVNEFSHAGRLVGRGVGMRRPRSVSSLSTPGCDLSASPPTVLLSPVLSRPVRSQSAHSSPFLVHGTSQAIGGHLHDSSDGEAAPGLGSNAMGAFGGAMRRQKITRHNDSSPLATPPLAHSPPVFGGSRFSSSGSFSRHPLQHPRYQSNNDSSGAYGGHVLSSRSPPHHPYRVQKQRSTGGNGSQSQNDSFDSLGSGSHQLSLLSPPSILCTSTRTGGGSVFLHRSYSDAQDGQQARQRFRQQHAVATRSLQSESAERHQQLQRSYIDRVKRMHRRPSNAFRPISSAAIVNQDFLPLNTSIESNSGQQLPMSTNRMRLRKLCPLGHSDPQLYTHSAYQHHSPSPNTSLLNEISPVRGAGAARRSFLNTSPLISGGKLKKESLLSASLVNTRRSSGSGSGSGRLLELNSSSPSSSIGGGGGSQQRRHTRASPSSHVDTSATAQSGPVRMRMRSFAAPSSTSNISGSVDVGGGAGVKSIHHHLKHAQAVQAIRHGSGMRAGSSLAAPLSYLENRRWSLASLPASSSGISTGTPDSNTGSAFSSQHSSQEHLAEMLGDLKMAVAGGRFDSNDSYGHLPGFDEFGVMGFRPRSRSLNSPARGVGGLEGAASHNYALSSIYKERFPKAKAQMESRLQQFILANAPLSGFTTAVALNVTSGGAGTPPTSQTPPQAFVKAISPGPSTTHSHHSHHHHHRPSSPRPLSPLPPRPVSPLVTESATAVGNELVRSSSTSHYQYQPSLQQSASSTNLLATMATSPRSSFSLHPQDHSQRSPSPHPQHYNQSKTGHSRSGMHLSVGEQQAGVGTHNELLSPQPLMMDPHLLRVMSDGATRFLHHQICEIAADCLQKSRDDILTCAYFCDMSIRLDETLVEAEAKTSGGESYKFLSRLVKQLLMIVARAARLLECLEFDPGEFYQLLEEAEGAMRVHLGAENTCVPDLPQYIVSKLGLNKELLAVEQTGQLSPPDEFLKSQDEEKDERMKGSVDIPSTQYTASTEANAPKEEDFETIRLISNGAYGAVYLVRHKRTRQRFALKKMKKQTLLLRNQVEQVYAERDILTFTDNPFVVCFYGSFETRAHLCMLMEYVEGGDCASLLKSAGTIPIELARLYVAETVLAIEYLHSCGIVHRDLKPDNLLITAMGHIKLTDFGLSKIGLMNRTTLVSEGFLDDTQQFKDNQLCGTPEYIAPEVILRQGYGKPVDWWALGIILYEFLVGIVPFLGDTPEDLFTNIINEEVEYPSGDEALEADGESLIRLLLEKNPVDRLGTMGGASQVAGHPFFASLDFDSLLRQKAEFVPQLENDEDTSYFDSRVDRYNHDAADSADDEAPAVPMFWSFNTASPRHSIVGGQLELPPGGLAALQSLAAATASTRDTEEVGGEVETVAAPLRARQNAPPPLTSGRQLLRKFSSAVSDESHSGSGQGTPSTSGTAGSGSHQSAFSTVQHYSTRLSTFDSQDSQAQEVCRLTGGGEVERNRARLLSDANVIQPIPSAVILRRRFSATRHANHSTSSSGTGTTTTTTGCAVNTVSSTDSSMDASAFGVIAPTGVGSAPKAAAARSLPRFAISTCDPLRPTGGLHQTTLMAELSPVEEMGISAGGHSRRMDKRPSAVVHELITGANSGDGRVDNLAKVKSSRSESCRSEHSLLRVLIPGQASTSGGGGGGGSSSLAQQSQQQATAAGSSYYHSYAPSPRTLGQQALAGGNQLSPSCHSNSSVSSFDSSNSPNPSATAQHPHRHPSSSLSPLPPVGAALPPPSGSTAVAASSSPSSSTSQVPTSKPITIRKGPQGYGFTIRSVRVYLSDVSEYYTIEHLVAGVKEHSPAWEAGLRENDLITHVQGKAVHNVTHPQLMHRLLQGGELLLHVVPMSSTSIKEGDARKCVGKLLRKRPRQPAVAQKKGPRRASALLRRVSGKRAGGEVVPGTSSQKQTFMPRSVSSQDGALNQPQPPTTSVKSNFLTAEPPPPPPHLTSSSVQRAAAPSAASVSASLHKKRLSIPTSAANSLLAANKPLVKATPDMSSRVSSCAGGQQSPRKHSIGAGGSAAPMPLSPLARLPSTGSSATATPNAKEVVLARTEEARKSDLQQPPLQEVSPMSHSSRQQKAEPSSSHARRISPSRLVQRLLSFRAASSKDSNPSQGGGWK